MVRRKHRYLVFKAETENREPLEMTPSEIAKAFHTPFFEMFGDFGAGCVLPSLRLITWMPDKGIGVIKLVREWAENFKTFIDELDSLNDVPVKMSVVHISGTIDQAQSWIDDNPTIFE